MGMVDIIASDSDDRKVFFLQKKKKKIQWCSRRIAADNKTCYLGECLQKNLFSVHFGYFSKEHSDYSTKSALI